MKHQLLGRQDFPYESVMPAVAQHSTELVVGVALVIVFIWGVMKLVRNNDARLLICMIAGFACVLNESYAMGMLKFVYPPVGQNILYVGFSRPVPVFMGMEYCAFFGLANYLYLSSPLASRWSAKAFWIGIVGLVLAEALLEVVSINLGLWAYFDDQANMILDFPVHVAVIVACMSMVLGAVSRLWFDYVKAIRQWLLVLLAPATMIGLFSVFAYPVSFGIESAGGADSTRIGSFITIVVGLTIAYSAVKLLSRLPKPS